MWKIKTLKTWVLQDISLVYNSYTDKLYTNRYTILLYTIILDMGHRNVLNKDHLHMLYATNQYFVYDLHKHFNQGKHAVKTIGY